MLNSWSTAACLPCPELQRETMKGIEADDVLGELADMDRQEDEDFEAMRRESLAGDQVHMGPS